MRKTRLTLLLGLVISSNGNATVNEPLVNSNNVNLFEFGTVDTAWNSSRNDKTLFVLMAQELQKNRLFVVRPTNLFSQRDADDTHYSFNTTLYGDPNLSVIGSDLYVTNRTDLDGQVKVEYVQRKLNDKGYAGVVELSSRDCGYNNLANFEFHRVILKDGVPTAIGSVYKTKRNGADVYAVVIPLEKGFPCQFYPLTESKKKVPIVQFTALEKNKINYIVDTNKVSARVWNKIVLPKGMHPAYFGVPSGLSAQSDLLRK